MFQIRRRPRIGLALSGGGARGFAHIGVLKVLEREKVPIDFIAGTSAGGVVAALYAAGFSAAELEAEARRLSRPRNLAALVDLSLPRGGLFSGEKIEAYIRSLIGDKTFAELKIPLALIAVDLETGEEVALDHGSVADAVQATTALPGVFQPCLLEGRTLVDGGLLNNLPADVVRRMGADVVIAVDVSAGMEDLAGMEEAVRKPRFLPSAGRTLETLSRCLEIMVTYVRRSKLEQARPEVLIRPEMNREISLFRGFTRAAVGIAAGEKAAEEALPEVRALMKRRYWPWQKSAKRIRQRSRS